MTDPRGRVGLAQQPAFHRALAATPRAEEFYCQRKTERMIATEHPTHPTFSDQLAQLAWLAEDLDHLHHAAAT